MAGLYIHIPFCASRCIYCDFYSTTGRNRISFIQRILEEAQKEKDSIDFFGTSPTFKTIYIGGGTPSQLSPIELNQLVNGLCEIFDLNQVEEFTIEANPEDITPEYVKALPERITRVSMGVQSFINTELQVLRRRHDSLQPKKAVEILKDHGIKNISIDLMYGLPFQTLESFEQSINEALALDIEHISAYCLSIEEGTPLSQMVEKGDLQVSDEDLCNQMNELLRKRLKDAGFIQYEISNYARSGFESKHNSSYWDGTPYLGLGPGAHSYNGDTIRRWNEPDLNAYLSGNVIREQEILTEENLYNESIMLPLRTRAGIDAHQLERRFPSFFQRFFLPEIVKLEQEELIVATKGSLNTEAHPCTKYRLTEQGLKFADAIIRRLII